MSKRIASSAIIIFSCLLAMTLPLRAQENGKETEQLDFAQGLLSRGMYDMAILQCQKFITDYPHSPSLQTAYLSLGESYFLSQEFDKALNVFNQFKQLFPQSDQLPVGVLRLGQIALQEKNYDDAIKQLTSFDTQKQLKGQMLQSFDYYTAQAYLGKGDLTSAMDYFQKASQVDGAQDYTAYAFEEMGKIHVQNQKYADALNDYAKALVVAPDNNLKGELTYRIAETEFFNSQFADAIKGFQQVMDQYSQLGVSHNALANMLLAYFNLGQYDQLIAQYQKDAKLIKDDESDFSVHYVALQAFIELKQFDQAAALSDHVLGFASLKPQEVTRIYIKKADILLRQKKYEDALNLLSSHTVGSDDADEAFFILAQGYFGMGQYDKAFNSFENVYLNFPGSRFYQAALLGQAHARQKMGRFKEAAGLFNKYYGLQDDPKLKSEALYDAVMMAEKAQDIDTTISTAQDYLKNFPNGDEYGQVLLILADSYGNNNQPQEAVKLLQSFLSSPQASLKPNAANFLLGFNDQLLGDNAAALSAYQKVSKSQEDGKFYTAALKNMAIICLNQKNFDQARIYFDQLITQEDQNDLQIKTYVWVCNEFLKLQKYDDVLRIASQAEKHFAPADLQEILYFKAEAYRALNRCPEAIQEYALVTAAKDKDAYTGSAHIGTGLCLAYGKQYDAANVEYQKALDENSEDYTITVHARYEMANADLAEGKIDDALKFYLLIATIYDDNFYCSNSLLAAGKIFEGQHKKDEALKVYNEILDKYKNSPAASYAQERVRALQ